MAGSIAFGLFVALIALLFGGVAWWPINKFLWTSEWQKLFAWGTIIFFLAVPLIAFITWLVRRIMRVRSRRGYLGWTFGALWFIGWVSVVLLAASLTKDFRNYEEQRNDITISQPAGKLTVGVTQPELMYSGGFSWIDNDPDGWDISDDTLRLSWVNIDVTKSIDSNYRVIVWKNSWGKNNAVATDRAGKIAYEVSYSGSFLDLSSGYAIDKESKFRGQHVVVEVQVPVGKKIRFDRTVTEKLNNVEIQVNDRDDWRRNRYRRGIHIRDYDFKWSTDVDYVMGEDGILYNPDQPGKPAAQKDGYRYDNNKSRKEQLQEELKRLEEQEKKDSLNKLKQSKKESMDDIEPQTLSTGFISPVFSMVKFIY
ncbi:MAG: ABC transporter permease [Bacteroidia bacterium]|nr:ABC transporter permease [Bacteroidia bacterium]